MGIVNLNRFLIDNCKKTSIHKQPLSSLKNKTIVIDTSIYLYKYTAQNGLFENFYTMISLFREYEIIPIFVFDGKPPPEKYELLRARKIEKQDAEQQYKILQLQLESDKDNITPEQKKEFQNELDLLKTRFIRIRYSDIMMVKRLMNAYGVTFYDACGEADQVCAAMVLSGKAWACMSDDMDMLVYGCSHVIRHFSIANKNVLVYHIDPILSDLKMDMETFRKVAVLSGTDYNIDLQTSLVKTMKWYEEYIGQEHKEAIDFYSWLLKTTKYIKDYDKLLSTIELFHLDSSVFDEIARLGNITYKEYDNEELHKIMAEDGFVFAKK